MDRLLGLLDRLDVFFVGVHCALPELERRARERGENKLAEARADHALAHTFGVYDCEVDTTATDPHQAARDVVAAWRCRQRPSAFEKMAHSAPHQAGPA